MSDQPREESVGEPEARQPGSGDDSGSTNMEVKEQVSSQGEKSVSSAPASGGMLARLGLRRLVVGAVLLLVLLAMGGAYVVFHQLDNIRDKLFERRSHVTARCIRQGRQYQRAGRNDMAFRYYQLAIDNALSDKTRAEAGLAMGGYLAERAEDEPYPHAIMARQYLEAVLELEDDSQKRFRCYRELIKVCGFSGEIDRVREYSAQARELASEPAVKAALLIQQIDIGLNQGTWAEARDLILEVRKYMDLEGYREKIFLRDAMFAEKMLINDKWFEQWLDYRKSEGDASGDVAKFRKRLYEKTVGVFERLSKCGIARISEEALFRASRLLYREGDYELAQQHLDRFLAMEPHIRQVEAMMLFTQLSRALGKERRAEMLISSFLERFHWNEVAAEEFEWVIDQAVKNGKHDKALSLIDQYKHLPEGNKDLMDLLQKAGRIAIDSKMYKKALGYYTELLSVAGHDKVRGHAMVQIAAMERNLGNDNESLKWISKFLGRYPYHDQRGKALYMLLDIQIEKGASDGTVIKTAIAAVNADSRNEKALDTLMLVGRKLEAMGLPGLAQEQYDKISLLRFVKTGKSTGPRFIHLDNESTIAKAILGNARCLMKIGEEVKADRLLRELCNSLEPGRLHSEAAYNWALIALKNDQAREAMRRFNLIHTELADKHVAAKTVFEKMRLNMGERGYSKEAADDLLAHISDMPGKDNTEFIRKAYLACFDSLYQEGRLDEMKELLELVRLNNHSDYIPMVEMNLRLGKSILKDRGMEAFIAYIKSHNEYYQKVGVNTIIDNVDGFRRKMGKYL